MIINHIDGSRMPSIQLASHAQETLNAIARKQKKTCNRKKQLEDLPVKPPITGGEGVAYKPTPTI